jgi:hypothetical protein
LLLLIGVNGPLNYRDIPVVDVLGFAAPRRLMSVCRLRGAPRSADRFVQSVVSSTAYFFV